MSETKRLAILRVLLGMGVVLAAFWSSANTGWMNPVLNLPGAAPFISGATLIWMLVAVLWGGALTDRKNFVYLMGLLALIPSVLILMVQPFVR